MHPSFVSGDTEASSLTQIKLSTSTVTWFVLFAQSHLPTHNCHPADSSCAAVTLATEEAGKTVCMDGL